MPKQIVITISPDGSSQIDAQNFKGKGCADATEAIALTLAGSSRDKGDDRKKPDYFATNPQAQSNRN